MKRFFVYSLIVISAFNNILLCTTPWIPVEVRHVYEAAQRGDAALVEKNLEWHREHDKKKPVAMLEQARDMAVAHNDAKAAVFLTTRLKQEQMGSWEKYFRGITLVATIAAVTGAFIGGNIFLKGAPSTQSQGQSGAVNAGQSLPKSDPSLRQETSSIAVRQEANSLPVSVVDFEKGSYYQPRRRASISGVSPKAPLVEALPRRRNSVS